MTHYAVRSDPASTRPLESPAEASWIVTDDQTSGRCKDTGSGPADGGPQITRDRLRRENLAFAGTAGVSDPAGRGRFVPAFREERSGRVELSRYANGKVAPLHVMDGLPEAWVEARTESGAPARLKAGVVAGFVRDGRFYTREQAAELAD